MHSLPAEANVQSDSESKNELELEPTDSIDPKDYVIVGGGLAGCTLAARLHRKDPSLDICVIERNREDASDDSLDVGSMAYSKAHDPDRKQVYDPASPF